MRCFHSTGQKIYFTEHYRKKFCTKERLYTNLALNVRPQQNKQGITSAKKMNIPASIYSNVKITAIISETDDAKTFELSPLNGWDALYEAGQFITLVFSKGKKEDRRSYSFSSAPILNEPMRITVKRIANGEYSRRLID